VFSGHLQVTRIVCLEEVIQVSYKIKYAEIKFNEISLSLVLLNERQRDFVEFCFYMLDFITYLYNFL